MILKSAVYYTDSFDKYITDVQVISNKVININF
jgi:hypothetical protein